MSSTVQWNRSLTNWFPTFLFRQRDAYLHKRSIEEKKKANIATNEEKHLFSHFFDDDDSTRLPLKPQVNFYQWTGKVVVGGQEVIVLFDTGSTDFVVEKDAYCPGPTSKDTGKRAKVAWGDGSETAEVVVYRDHFRVGSLGEVDGVAVGHATTNFLANVSLRPRYGGSDCKLMLICMCLS